MSATADWLAELRQSKQQAIARVHAERAEHRTLLQTAEERLQYEHSTLAAHIGYMQIETLLQEFCAEILDGHPEFFGYSLSRTVRSRAVESATECKESDPWTGPVENRPLPRNLDLGNGRSAVVPPALANTVPKVLGFHQVGGGVNHHRGAFLVTGNTCYADHRSETVRRGRQSSRALFVRFESHLWR